MNVIKTMIAALLAMVAMTSSALAQDMAWRLNNNSGVTLWEFYTSPTSNPYWGPDGLGSNVLPSGSSATVYVPNGQSLCTFDIRFVFQDGSVMTDRVNMCQMASYTIN